ncbi:MAG: trypsin-like serine protease [Solirubrobacterales bacterium]|nr:trypsin-like serine protease [Solirubrobacterales bacterium]OJU94064.1 MAG: hypothetical protein BGO23_10770 [Solirubrobacterales bacterium 67-14]
MGKASRAKGEIVGAAVLAAILAVFLFTFSSTALAASIVNQGAPPPKVSKVDGSGVSSVVFRQSASTDRFWTRERLLSAKPADNQPPAASFDLPDFSADATASAATGDFTPGNVTDFPQRIQGKIFFKLGDAVYSCSGTVVDSAEQNVVFTAGHCLFDQTEHRYVDKLVFIPGYENGTAPFKAPLDVIDAASGKVPDQWINSGTNSYDIAVIGLSQPVQKALGSRQIAFDLNPALSKTKGREYTIYGYPSQPSNLYNGEVLRGCQVAFSGFDNSSGNITPYPMSGNPCLMQQGASGGGWITLGNYLNSVVSYGYCDDLPNTCGFIFGPYFSNAAKSLYVTAGGSPAPTIKLVKSPPKVVRKRAVTFKFKGSAATLLGFVCKLDGQKKVNCASKISIKRLRPGKHTLKAWAVDQTGHMSKKKVVRRFRVVVPRR